VRADDLVAPLRQLQHSGAVDKDILSNNGVADPLVLTWMLSRPDLADLARLDCVITVVDAVNFAATSQSAEWQAQVRCADLCVISKLDLAPPGARAEVEHAVREAGGTDRFIDGGDDLPFAILLDADPRAAALRSTQAAPHGRHSGYRALSLVSDATHDATRFEDWLEALPPQVFRAKGIVKVERGWLSFNTVGGRLDVDPTVSAPPHGESRLVFLGPELDEAELTAALQATRA
jgi:G3E family GTPase